MTNAVWVGHDSILLHRPKLTRASINQREPVMKFSHTQVVNKSRYQNSNVITPKVYVLSLIVKVNKSCLMLSYHVILGQVVLPPVPGSVMSLGLVSVDFLMFSPYLHGLTPDHLGVFIFHS